MRSEKGLSRYREEQNLNESDLNLSGFVHLFFFPFSSSQILLSFRLFYIVQICSPNAV